MSVADTLHDAIADIDRYLHDGTGYDLNSDHAIIAVRDVMESLRCRLDVDLEGNEPHFRTIEETGVLDDEDEEAAS